MKHDRLHACLEQPAYICVYSICRRCAALRSPLSPSSPLCTHPAFSSPQSAVRSPSLQLSAVRSPQSAVHPPSSKGGVASESVQPAATPAACSRFDHTLSAHAQMRWSCPLSRGTHSDTEDAMIAFHVNMCGIRGTIDTLEHTCTHA